MPRKQAECLYCGSADVEYTKHGGSCNDCGEQWDAAGQDTK